MTEQELARLNQIIAKVERIEGEVRIIGAAVKGAIAGGAVALVLMVARDLCP